MVVVSKTRLVFQGSDARSVPKVELVDWAWDVDREKAGMTPRFLAASVFSVTEGEEWLSGLGGVAGSLSAVLLRSVDVDRGIKLIRPLHL